MGSKRFITYFVSTIFFFAYYIVNLLTLSVFPYVHSDEPWLAGLTRAYMTSKTIFVTEPFFDTFPRNPHAIKSLFHLIQSNFIRLFGYNIISVRIMSLIFGMLCLLSLYMLFYKISDHHGKALLMTAIPALNIQFIYASHFARQEILLLFVLIAAYYIYSQTDYKMHNKALLMGVIIGLSIGLHPNAFIIAMMLAFILLVDTLSKKMHIKHLLTYVATLAFFAVAYITISLIGNSNFFSDYWAYGQTLSVDAAPISRLSNFIEYYIKLDTQNSGTYYLPNIHGYLMIFILMLVIATTILITDKKLKTKNLYHAPHQLMLSGILMTIGFNVAIFIIGRMNPTSIIFILLPGVLLFIGILLRVSLSNKVVTIILVLAVLLSANQANSQVQEVISSTKESYFDYEQAIKNHLPSDAVVLGNLSSGFIFKDIEFYDIRNLHYLDNMSVEAYVSHNAINTIIYYEAYDYIHRNPQWQILYGDDSGYYDQLKQLIETDGILVHEFQSPTYGNRIIRYMNDYPWTVKIYYIDTESSY